MRQWAVLLLCLMSVVCAFGQTPLSGDVQQSGSENLFLVHSEYGRMNNKLGLMVYYGGVYEHKGNTLAADSSYIYEDENKSQFFEAFGNVVITQPSGTVIYADKLHYDALIQLATLTGNVRMVDANSVLTTNYLTYNMRSKTGTYRTGGRIVSQGDTITSKNAYYFENTADAYFRHDVIVRTPNVKVYTDSMRYNSISKETYFFGPTNIKGTQGENLYTERGNYNTGTGIARFNLNNLYTEGTKFLKGDSLYYNRDLGIGEAHRNVVFVDTLDKFYALGDKGLYRQEDESIMMTEKPLIIMVVKNDSTETATDSLQNDLPVQARNTENAPLVELEEEDSLTETADSTSLIDITHRGQRDSIPKESNMDSVYLTADTLFSRMIPLKDYKPLELNLSRDGGALLVEEEEDYGDGDDFGGDDLGLEAADLDQGDLTDEVGQLKRGVEVSADSTQRKVVASLDTVSDALRDSIPKVDLKPVVDLVKKEAERPRTKPKGSATEQSVAQTLKADSVLRQQAVIPTGSEAEDKIAEAMRVATTADSTQREPIVTSIDSTDAVADTAKTRIVRAFYNVRLFKSDLQAVADSVYYGMADSMFRFMGRPMIWAQDSQISADTIFMQIVNQQVDNALLKDNAFMVNATLDTLKFNQLKGRLITAFFTNNNIDRIYVDGNAENIAFSVNEKARVITEMFHDRGSRIKVKLENREIIDYTTVQSVDQKIYPFSLVTQENEILPGFIWRPQDRPTSKEDLLNRKRELDRGEAVTGGDSTASDGEREGLKTPPGNEEHTDTLPIESKTEELKATETEVKEVEILEEEQGETEGEQVED